VTFTSTFQLYYMIAPSHALFCLELFPLRRYFIGLRQRMFMKVCHIMVTMSKNLH